MLSDRPQSGEFCAVRRGGWIAICIRGADVLVQAADRGSITARGREYTNVQ